MRIARVRYALFYPFLGGVVFLVLSFPMFLWDVALGVHNPTPYGAIYFLINCIPVLLFIESGVFMEGRLLGGLTVVQMQSIIAVASSVFWMAILAAFGIMVDRTRRGAEKKPQSSK